MFLVGGFASSIGAGARKVRSSDRAESLVAQAFRAYHQLVIPLPPIEVGEPMTVSATLYKTYLACPQQALGRLRGEFPPDSLAAFKGSLAHRLFARHLVDGPIQDVTAACREEIGIGKLNVKLQNLGIGKPSALAPVIAEVGDLYTRFKRFPTDGFRSAEVSIEADIGADVRLVGLVDAIFDEVNGTRIVDWKTGAFVDDTDGQLDFYCHAWVQQHGELPAMAEAVSVKTGERSTLEPTLERATATGAAVVEMVNTLRRAFREREELERRAGPHCRWCPLLDGCAEGRAATAVSVAG
jgi:PD-(D/E)XK nuclease superfamily